MHNYDGRCVAPTSDRWAEKFFSKFAKNGICRLVTTSAVNNLPVTERSVTALLQSVTVAARETP